MQPHQRQHLRRQLIRRLSKSGGTLNLKEVTPAEQHELERMAEEDLIEFEPQSMGLICRLKRRDKSDDEGTTT